MQIYFSYRNQSTFLNIREDYLRNQTTATDLNKILIKCNRSRTENTVQSLQAEVKKKPKLQVYAYIMRATISTILFPCLCVCILKRPDFLSSHLVSNNLLDEIIFTCNV
jgi:hypothetical protein